MKRFARSAILVSVVLGASGIAAYGAAVANPAVDLTLPMTHPPKTGKSRPYPSAMAGSAAASSVESLRSGWRSTTSASGPAMRPSRVPTKPLAT